MTVETGSGRGRREDGLERREFLVRAGALGAGLALPGGLLSACGDSGSGSGGTLAVGATNWLPEDFFVGNSLSTALIGWTQMAWPLFIGNGKGFEYENGLASGYEASPDGMRHTVTLRDGMKFHDGSPIDAEAVAANLKAAFFQDDPLRDEGIYLQVIITLGYPPIVKSVTTPDKRTVVIELTEYRSDIKTALALNPILNPKIMANKDYGTNVKLLRKGGSGPFRLMRFKAGDFAEFERFDGFFEEVVPERVRLQAYSDPGALALALKSGEIAVASGLSKADYDSMIKSGYKAVKSVPAVNADLTFSHPKDPAFADKRVRQAVGLAMNREAYTERFFNKDTASVSTQPVIPEGIPGYIPDLQAAPYDPEQARALLADAGVKSPKLEILAPTQLTPISSTKGMVEAIAQDLQDVGIDATAKVLPLAAEGSAIEDGKADAFVEAPGGQPDPFILFDFYFSSASPYAPGELKAYPQIGKWLTKAHKTKDVAARDGLLQDIIRTANDEALMIPISVADYSAVTAEAVQDFPLSAVALDSWNEVSIDG